MCPQTLPAHAQGECHDDIYTIEQLLGQVGPEEMQTSFSWRIIPRKTFLRLSLGVHVLVAVSLEEVAHAATLTVKKKGT